MAIGTGYILGVVTPENFREPFLSVDIRDFWIAGISRCRTGSATSSSAAS